MINYPNSIIEQTPDGRITQFFYVQMTSQELTLANKACHLKAQALCQQTIEPFRQVYARELEEMLKRPDVLATTEPTPWVKSQLFYREKQQIDDNLMTSGVLEIKHGNAKKAHVFLMLNYKK